MKSQAEWINILKEAKKQALASINDDDGGSCNFDDVHVYSDLLDIEKACKSVGIQTNWNGDHITINPIQSQYQGFNRTKQVEAIQKVLENNGVKAYVSYVMD